MNNLTPTEVADRVCLEYAVTREQLASPTRKAAISDARQMLCYILLMKMDAPKNVVSELIGGRTTAAYLSEEGRSKIKRYAAEREKYERIWLR